MRLRGTTHLWADLTKLHCYSDILPCLNLYVVYNETFMNLFCNSLTIHLDINDTSFSALDIIVLDLYVHNLRWPYSNCEHS
jgi:hypothetical protein